MGVGWGEEGEFFSLLVQIFGGKIREGLPKNFGVLVDLPNIVFQLSGMNFNNGFSQYNY